MNTINITYTTRISQRAKRLHLRILPNQRVEVVVPKRFKYHESIERFVLSYEAWILKKLSAQPILIEKKLPSELRLQAVNEVWVIQYVMVTGKRYQLVESAGKIITILSPDKSYDAISSLLNNWLKQQAKKHFFSWMLNLSEQHYLPFKQLIVRSQKSLWGSCSSQGSINLNCRLLFLSPSLAQHVMLHELSHTKYLNHGKRFYQLLQKLDPNIKDHIAQLKQCKIENLPI